MQTIVVGKRGTIVIPAKTRKRFNLDEGSPMLLEEREDGILMRPAIGSAEVEVYTPARLAEFFLNNAMDRDDYLSARKEVEKLGLDPDGIDHVRWTK